MRRTRTALSLLAFLVTFGAARLGAQERWDPGSTLAGAALGTAAGATVGSVGSLLPCNDTRAGPHCVRWAAGASALLAGLAGAYLGGTHPERIEDAAIGGAIGLGVGVVLGVGLTPIIQRWGPQDAVALGLIGGAAGTAPVGAAVGFGGGALLGGLLWKTDPRFGAPKVAAMALGGLAAGVVTEWLVRAATTSPDPETVVVLNVRF